MMPRFATGPSNPDEAVEYIAAVQDTVHTGEGSSQVQDCCIGRDSLDHDAGQLRSPTLVNGRSDTDCGKSSRKRPWVS